MRKIEGFVCIARLDHNKFTEELLFGPKIHRDIDHNYEAFVTNNLTPFSKLKEAKIAQKELLNLPDDNLSEVNLGHLRIMVAETDNEVAQMRNRRKLIAIMQCEFNEILLFGHRTDNARSFSRLPAALLSENGILPFTKYDSALYATHEIDRQGACKSTLAAFRFIRL